MVRFQLKFYPVSPGIKIESEVKMRMGMNTARWRMYDRPLNTGDIVQFVSCMRPSCVQLPVSSVSIKRGGRKRDRGSQYHRHAERARLP